jgi:hypothetical protein
MSEERTYLANSASHDDKGGRIEWMDKVGRTLGKRSGRRWIKELAAIGETGESISPNGLGRKLKEEEDAKTQRRGKKSGEGDEGVG